MDLNVQLIKENIKFKFLKFIGNTYYGKRKKKIVFVLSTGRCGSTSIVKMFNQHPKFSAYHEDIPELIALSTKLAENPHSKEKIYKQLDIIFRNKIWSGPSNKIHVHSDHRLWNLVEFLSEYFPNSVFIHLIRNPYDSLKSFVPRNWYPDDFDYNLNDNIFEKYRLRGNRLGIFTEEEWCGFSNVEKCAWYWNYVNKCISAQLEELKPINNPSLLIQLEYITIIMNTRIREIFNLESDFFFKNIIANTTKHKKVISVSQPAIENSILKFAQAKNKFYPNYIAVEHQSFNHDK